MDNSIKRKIVRDIFSMSHVDRKEAEIVLEKFDIKKNEKHYREYKMDKWGTVNKRSGYYIYNGFKSSGLLEIGNDAPRNGQKGNYVILKNNKVNVEALNFAKNIMNFIGSGGCPISKKETVSKEFENISSKEIKIVREAIEYVLNTKNEKIKIWNKAKGKKSELKKYYGYYLAVLFVDVCDYSYGCESESGDRVENYIVINNNKKNRGILESTLDFIGLMVG